MNNKNIPHYLFAALAFVLPFGMYYFTHSDSLGFADAGEFALVTKIASVAHGPGFPAYVFLGWLCSSVISLFHVSHFTAIMLLSIASASAASMLLYITLANLIQRVYGDTDALYRQLVALCTALAFAMGFTVWYWASNIEVYAFHVFTVALILYGLLDFNTTRSTRSLIIAAIGIGLGLANHHLTTIMFLPFIFLFFGKDFFAKPVLAKQPVKKKREVSPSGPSIFDFIKSKQFVIFSSVAAGITVFFYGWMMVRASATLPFQFGQPDNLDRFFYHVNGGAWMNKTTAQVDGILGMRFPYFIWLLVRQYSVFILLAVAGLVQLFQRKWSRFAIVILGYFLLMQFYQLRLDQVGDSDAYLISPYYVLAFAIPFGAMWLIEKRKQLAFALPVLVLVQTVWNFPLDDKRSFDLSKGLMKTLDESAPKNSVILIADWTLVSEYYYYRIAENFRPDLTVINYDLKFTNYKILPVLYPEFYKKVQPEYDAFIKKLGDAHPMEIYNTGCTLDSYELLQAYANLFHKMETVCKADNTPLMYDPHAFVYLNENKLVPNNFFVSGCFVSQTKTDIKSNFLQMPYTWLNLPVIKHEPGASDKLVDFQAMLDFNSFYYKNTGDTASYNTAITSRDRIMKLQAELKENVAFTFRETGK